MVDASASKKARITAATASAGSDLSAGSGAPYGPSGETPRTPARPARAAPPPRGLLLAIAAVPVLRYNLRSR
ncbi:hypothetical protein ACFWY5_33570 [Nonomuraea sp. NPDC059007]|uniref:hypothetical protein n=1 Tax=Nonomuraea sp. NPDC059007 TaxID=3346692 RepID=UPI00369D02D2